MFRVLGTLQVYFRQINRRQLFCFNSFLGRLFQFFRQTFFDFKNARFSDPPVVILKYWFQAPTLTTTSSIFSSAGTSSPSIWRLSIYNFIASVMFTRASSLVSFSLIQPGSRGTVTVYQPDSFCSRITRKSLDITPSWCITSTRKLYHKGYLQSNVPAYTLMLEI